MSLDLKTMNFPDYVINLLQECKGYTICNSSEELAEHSTQGKDTFDVTYDVNGEDVKEAVVHKVKNGLSANYMDPYLRRRDPDCMVIGDQEPSDKVRFEERFGEPFDGLRQETMEWLKKQELLVFMFRAGKPMLDMDAIVIAPKNAAFFMFGLSLLQGIITKEEATEHLNPKGVVYVAPPFRHTHFDGKQVVVHSRSQDHYELFSYNLYPGPSAKKGAYGMLLHQGEQEGWVTTHCSAAQVLSPYDNITTFMHEGASGGGKSEMLEMMHREEDGRVLLGVNTKTGDKRLLQIPQTCKIMPVADDMAICHPSIQKDDGKLNIIDAETSWFLRVNHIDEYGTDHNLEKITVKPQEKLLFLNIDTTPNSTALIWEHIEDEPGVPCPNPRVVIPKSIMPDSVDEPVDVNVRSFGLRTPPCTKEKPSYGILGVFHIVPPALAWLWRLVSPRGFGNPSIIDTGSMQSEGVGSYWPFATGKLINQANLLLNQFEESSSVLNILTPNQHVGAWKCGFMPQWLMREYLTRRGNAKLSPKQYQPARSTLLGYELNNLTIEGTEIHERYLKVYYQSQVGEEAYDQGAKILREFFERELTKFYKSDLLPKGKEIIQCFLDKGSVHDYEKLISY